MNQLLCPCNFYVPAGSPDKGPCSTGAHWIPQGPLRETLRGREVFAIPIPHLFVDSKSTIIRVK